MYLKYSLKMNLSTKIIKINKYIEEIVASMELQVLFLNAQKCVRYITKTNEESCVPSIHLRFYS